MAANNPEALAGAVAVRFAAYSVGVRKLEFEPCPGSALSSDVFAFSKRVSKEQPTPFSPPKVS